VITGRGETYLGMGQYEDALADFDRTIALDPACAVAFTSRGRTRAVMGRYDDALSDLD